jgi:inhibitor of KinA
MSIAPLGDAALTITLGHEITDAVNQKVHALFRAIAAAGIPGITDIVPAYTTLTIYYNISDSAKNTYESITRQIRPFLTQSLPTENTSARMLNVPVCYHPEFGPDLEEMSRQKNTTVEALIQSHTAKVYRVYMVGFLPGFAYMGTVDEALATPRKARPRTSVPAGSVGIAGRQTGIYPFDSPGGWQLIGRTPITLFSAHAKDPVFFQPGDEVRFFTIGRDELNDYQKRYSR